MNTVLSRYGKYSRRRQRRAARSHQRLDIQGLRMVAVLTVFANHLWGWPHGGFIGVDVFFVISGFLITSNLLRTAETTGTISFRKFYWNRARRIIPAATVVLILTYVAALLVFLPFRANEIGVDAIFAFIFMANWHFAFRDTDYFAAASETISPIQHYWSLSIEEQFYFVWPAVIFAISLVVARRAWTHRSRMVLAGSVMGVIVAASLAWALYESATSPTWAYFNTFARVWELGIGAVLACVAGALTQIPESLRPWLSWGGLALIVCGLIFISEGSVGFPAPWALLPVAGASLVIAAGIGKEPRYQPFLRNPVSGYIGDISYSLYLVHWPVIVILGALADEGEAFYLTAIALSFGFAITSYHFIENPLRRADMDKFRHAWREIVKRRYQPARGTQVAAVSAAALIAVALTAFTIRPDAYEQGTPPPLAAVAPEEFDPASKDPALGPLTTALREEIIAALRAEEWPALNPSLESVVQSSLLAPEVSACTTDDVAPDTQLCTWGSPTAPVRIVLVGDSVALGYAGPLRDIALNSQGRIQVLNLAMGSCVFTNELIDRAPLAENCAARKQFAVDTINATKPTVVMISNSYGSNKIFGTDDEMSPLERSDSMQAIVDKFAASTSKIVLMAPPPADINIADCYSGRATTPADCISEVTQEWWSTANEEATAAKEIGLTWIDSRPWFCSAARLCPSFVGTIPTKRDRVHLVPAYGTKIYPVMLESFTEAGVL